MARRRFRSVNRALTLKRVGLMALGVVLVIGAVIAVSALIKQKDSFGTVTELPFFSESAYAFTGEGFYYIDNDKLVYHDLNDPEGASSVQLGAQQVAMCSSKSILALYSGASVQLMGTGGVIDAGGEVMGIRCGASHVAVMRKLDSGDAAVLVYDAAGALIDTIDQGNALLVDCGITETSTGDVLWTLMLDSTGTVPVNTLTTYTYAVDGAGVARASMSGVMTVQGQLVDGVVFTGNSIFICGTGHLIRCNAGVSSEAYRLLTYGYRMRDYSSTGTKPLFVYVERGVEAPERVKLYGVSEGDVAEVTAREIILPQGTHSFFAAGGKLYCFTSSEILVYSATGALSAQYALEFTCDGASKLDDKHVLVSCGGAMKLITLK